MGAAADFAQLASQISTKTIYSFVRQIPDVPKQVSSLLELEDPTPNFLQSLAENRDSDEVTLRTARRQGTNASMYI